jgi:Lrp/AsnC family leucine-responsive transcriptional regulator
MAYEIDEIDKKILFHLDINARIKDVKLAKLVGRSKEATRYRILRLEKNKIIKGYSAWIDPTKLGYLTYKMYLKLENIPKEKKEFLEFVKSEKSVFWLGVGSGAWNVALTFFSRTPSEFYRLRQRIFSKFGHLIVKCDTGSVVNIWVKSKDFLSDSSPTVLDLFEDPQRHEIDSLDRDIMERLFHNSRIRLVELAKELKSNPETIKQRIRKLENRKIIVGYHAIVDFEKLGYEFFKAFVYFRNLSDNDEKRFISYMKQRPEVVYFLRTIAPWEMELETLVKNYGEYTKLLNDIEEKFSSVILGMDSTIMSEDCHYPSRKVVAD